MELIREIKKGKKSRRKEDQKEENEESENVEKDGERSFEAKGEVDRQGEGGGEEKRKMREVKVKSFQARLRYKTTGWRIVSRI